MAKRRNFSSEEIKDICDFYTKNQARKPLAEKYGCTDKVILRVLKENNIKIRHVLTRPKGTENRKYNVNDDYFNINNQTHNSAYILGMLASDGCVASDQNQIYIELQREDKELLEKINKELQNEREVKDYENHSKNTLNSKLYFFSQQIKTDLALYHIIPNKTAYDNDFMENIKEEFYMDYIRGHFDGDGSIKWTGGSINWQIDSTSLSTLIHMRDVLLKYGIETKITQSKDVSTHHHMPLYRIYFYGQENGKKIYNLFYSNSDTIRMKRKQEKFQELLLKYKNPRDSESSV